MTDTRPIADLIADADRALARYLAAIALRVCDRYEDDDVGDDALGNDIADLRRVAGYVEALP